MRPDVRRWDAERFGDLHRERTGMLKKIITNVLAGEAALMLARHWFSAQRGLCREQPLNALRCLFFLLAGFA